MKIVKDTGWEAHELAGTKGPEARTDLVRRVEYACGEICAELAYQHPISGEYKRPARWIVWVTINVGGTSAKEKRFEWPNGHFAWSDVLDDYARAETRVRELFEHAVALIATSQRDGCR